MTGRATPEMNERIREIMNGYGFIGTAGLTDSSALGCVIRERIEQRSEFPSNLDDELSPAEWIARIAKHLGRAVSRDPQVFRREMVIVGALVLAAVESFDRRYPSDHRTES